MSFCLGPPDFVPYIGDVQIQFDALGHIKHATWHSLLYIVCYTVVELYLTNPGIWFDTFYFA